MLKQLIEKEYKFDKWTIAMILLLVVVFSAIFGFIYEELFYRIDLGHFVKRGTTFGPWIPIYGFGGLFIIIIAYHFRKKPILVLLLSALVSGTLEFLTGYILYTYQGLRLWDYNTEIWNWGNIGGYICFRSVLFFGVSGLFLIYLVIPILKYIASKIPKVIFSIIAIIPTILFLTDFIISDII